VRPPEVQDGLLFGCGHPLQDDLEIVDRSDGDGEVVSQSVGDARLAGA
jgi:hypothetical protein